MQQGWSLPVPLDVLEMWSEPVANEGLNRGFCVEGYFVGTRIKWSSVGEDGAAGKPANCNAK